MKSARDGGEEGEGREHSELHDGREEGAVVLERESDGGKRGIREYLYETEAEGARFLPTTGEMTSETPLQS